MADEIILAYHLLDNMPGYYRENYPERAKEIKALVNKNLMSIYDYANNEDEFGEKQFEEARVQLARMDSQPRGEVLVNKVRDLNRQGIEPHLFEVGPSNYFMPIGLAGGGCKFTYSDLNFNSRAKEFIKSKNIINFADRKPDDYKMYLFCEIIEHLWRTEDAVDIYRKYHNEADWFMLSTPRFTMGGGLDSWKTRQLGHIRTWTPKEISTFATEKFPEFDWHIYSTPMMVMVGDKINGTN